MYLFLLFYRKTAFKPGKNDYKTFDCLRFKTIEYRWLSLNLKRTQLSQRGKYLDNKVPQKRELAIRTTILYKFLYKTLLIGLSNINFIFCIFNNKS